MVERRFFGAFRGWWCCMFPGPSPWPIGHQFVGWGVIKKKIEIPTTLAQQALTLSTTFWEIMTRELHYQQSKQSKITLLVSNSFTGDWSIRKWNFGFVYLFQAYKGWSTTVGWGVIKKKIEIPTTLAQQALMLSTTFWEIMTTELHYQ